MPPRRDRKRHAAAPRAETASRVSPATIKTIALIALTLIVYIPAMRSGFTWDDDLHVLDNIVLKEGGLARTWFSIEQPNYWPITWTAFWAQWNLWNGSPAGFHVVNVLLHALNALLIWRILLALAVPAPWLCALVFAVHPVNVECAAWITQLKTLLSMTLYLCSIMLHIKADGAARRWQYAASIAVFVAAMLCKPAAVMLPVVLVGIAWWRGGRVGLRDLLLAAPFFAIAGGMALMEVWFQHYRAAAGAVIRTDGVLQRILGSGMVAVFYAWKALLPVGLNTVYPRWTISLANPLVWVPLPAIVAVLSLAWWKQSSWGRAVLFGLGYFLASLLPVMGFANIYFMRYSFVADHWQYFAIIGVIALVVGGGAHLAMMRGPQAVRAGTAAAVAIVAVFCVLSWNHQAAFRDFESFYRTALKTNPDASLALNNLGDMLIKRGEVQEALPLLERSMKVDPDHPEAFANYASALAVMGRVDDALPYLRKVSELSGTMFEAHNRLGETYMKYGRLDEAVAEFNRAIELEPNCASAEANLGLVAARRGDTATAIAQFRRAIDLAPRFARAYEYLAHTLAGTGRHDEAVQVYRGAIAQLPRMAELRNNFAAALAGMGRHDDAIRELHEALRVRSGFAPAHKNLGAIYLKKGRLQDARIHLQEALRYDPAEKEAQMLLEELDRVTATPGAAR